MNIMIKKNFSGNRQDLDGRLKTYFLKKEAFFKRSCNTAEFMLFLEDTKILKYV